jgi:hypothetical protein
LLDWSAGNDKNGSSVMLTYGLLPTKSTLKVKAKTRSTPSLTTEMHMSEREKTAQLQDFINSLKQIKEIEKIHELIDDFRAGKFEDVPDVKTALSIKKITQLETEKIQLKEKVVALEKKIKEVTDATNFAQTNNSQLNSVVEEQHKTIINLTKRITGVQMEFKEYREVLGRRRPPKLTAETLSAIRNSLVSEGTSKEIAGFLAFLSSIEETEKRYQMKQQAFVVPEHDKSETDVLGNCMTPVVRAIKDGMKNHVRVQSGQDVV